MRRYGILGIGAAAVALIVAIPRSPAIAPAAAPPVNHPPVVTSSLPPNAAFPSRAPIRFTVTVTDPDGDAVFAKVVDAPREMGFAPIVNAPSGATREVVFYPSNDAQSRRSDGGPQRLVVESWDSRQPWIRTQTILRFRVIGGISSHGLRIMQTDHDPEPEFVARAPWGDVRAFADAGAYVLFDQPAPPAGAVLKHELWIGNPLQLYADTYATEQIADVNGDGLDDLVSVQAQKEIAIWFGGSHVGTHPADVTLPLEQPVGVGGDFVPRILVADVTGDGIDDVLVACPWVDTNVKNEGEVVVFAGGPGLAGTIVPTATLRVPGASPSDSLGRASDNLDPFLIGDVTGDGVADVVVITPWADVAGTPDAGAIYVWSGGAALTGAPVPTATLVASGSSNYQLLGLIDTAPAVFLVDVTGDGQLDVVAGCPKSSPDGAIFVWKGGSGITGTVAQTARLQPSAGGAGGSGGKLLDTNGLAVQGLQFADLDLDGITDVVAARPLATVRFKPSGGGSVLVFRGGALSGTVKETALLQRAAPVTNDWMTYSNNGMQLVDVTGDGAPDVVCASRNADANATNDGVIDVFAARSGLAGNVMPSAELAVPGAGSYEALTWSGGYSTGLLVEDVTGDGIRDVVGVAEFASVSLAPGAGAIYVWAGGSSLTSGTTVAPNATLSDPNPRSYSYLGNRSGQGQSVHFVDWDDDGVKDLVAFERGEFPSNPKAPACTDRVLVWRGGATLAGTPPLLATALSHQPEDWFGGFIDSADGLWFDDVTGDGSVDLLVTASGYDTSGGEDAGAVYVFAGGPAATGVLAPAAMLTDPLGMKDDAFGGSSEFRFADLDGNGVDEIVATVPETQGVGRLLLFRGPIGSAPNGLDATVPELGVWSRLGD